MREHQEACKIFAPTFYGHFGEKGFKKERVM